LAKPTDSLRNLRFRRLLSQSHSSSRYTLLQETLIKEDFSDSIAKKPLISVPFNVYLELECVPARRT